MDHNALALILYEHRPALSMQMHWRVITAMDVKQESRRARIADAVLELGSREGLERVTLRAVAAEAGVSMGQVQHYFASREDMLFYAVTHGMQGMERRIRERIGIVGADWPDEDADLDPDDADFDAALEMLGSMLEEMLGADPETRRLLRVGGAFLSLPAPDERIVRALTDDDPQLRGFTAQTVEWAQALGRADSALDPTKEAEILWALVGQLGSDVVLGRLDPADASATLRYALGRVFRPLPDPSPGP